LSASERKEGEREERVAASTADSIDGGGYREGGKGVNYKIAHHGRPGGGKQGSFFKGG